MENNNKKNSGCTFGKLVQQELGFIGKDHNDLKEKVEKRIDEEIMPAIDKQRQEIRELTRVVDKTSWVPPVITAVVMGIVMWFIDAIASGIGG